MAQEAEKYASDESAQEEKLQNKFEARNKENIEEAVQDAMDWLDKKNQIAEKSEFETGDKENIEEAVQDAVDWLDKNQMSEKDEFEAADKENIEEAVQDARDWLDKNKMAEKDEFGAKQHDVKLHVRHIVVPNICRCEFKCGAVGRNRRGCSCQGGWSHVCLGKHIAVSTCAAEEWLLL